MRLSLKERKFLFFYRRFHCRRRRPCLRSLISFFRQPGPSCLIAACPWPFTETQFDGSSMLPFCVFRRGGVGVRVHNVFCSLSICYMLSLYFASQSHLNVQFGFPLITLIIRTKSHSPFPIQTVVYSQVF